MGSTAPFNLAHYGCDIYVETGTGHANCLKQAVASNCFKRHYSVDIDEILVRDARRVFPQANNRTRDFCRSIRTLVVFRRN